MLEIHPKNDAKLDFSSRVLCPQHPYIYHWKYELQT